MKILFYYWMQYNDLNSRGGGVQVYLRNVINNLRNRMDIQIYTLSSGTAYDLSGKCHVEKMPSDGNVQRFQIVNSPMLAPSKASFYDQEIYLNDYKIKDILRNFIRDIGGVDVIHFQSLEGLTIRCLELKKEFKNTRFILSLHNYQVFCPQVNLWKDDSISCDDFHDGRDCLSCLGAYPQSSRFKRYYQFDFYLRKVGLGKYSRPLMNEGKNFYNKLFNKDVYKVKRMNTSISPKDYALFRRRNVIYINTYIDKVLCVSNRVREIAIQMGIDKSIAVTSYIGSKFAEHQHTSSEYKYLGDILKIAYMGYMRKDKGFFFFLDALEKMPLELSKKISVVVAARYDDLSAVNRLESLKNRFANIALYDGYTHKDIPKIIDGVHLGVVPVLWEDNLPQVAIEFKAMGIPVLASNRGGASELSASQYFVFQSGNHQDFMQHLEYFVNNPRKIEDYWDKQIKLQDMSSHIQSLLNFYQ